jgi:hypothetical protein
MMMKINYEYPKHLLPDYHHAVYQLIVGVEQGHSRENLLIYAKKLRGLASDSFVTLSNKKL